jgi:two-component system response regulator DegU
MKTKIKIALAEDMPLFRKSLISLLKENSKIDVVAEAANGKELLEKLKNVSVDIVLLDVEMPIMDGKTTLGIIKKRFPELKVIILSIHADRNLSSELMSLGANSYLCKKCEPKVLFEAIEKVKSEGYYFDSFTSKAMLDTIIKEKSAPALPEEVSFNHRESEILKAICNGKTNKEIAIGLNLSISTVDFYRAKIYSKAKCNNVTSLVKFALKNGIISLT